MFRSLLILLGFVVLLSSCSPTTLVQPENGEIHLATGNLTNATTNANNDENYLLVKPQYAMSYNNTLRHANWVSWELSAKWIGLTDRSDDFRPDTELPSAFYQVTASDYVSSGFDRGHLCPSADRTRNQSENSATFVMSNMIPQSPELNRNAWANLENYCRKLADAGYLLYITAGAYGTGGDGSKGESSLLKSGVNVPERVYKVIVATQKNNVNELDKSTIIIATDFPNSDLLVQNRDWVRFISTPEDIEKRANVTFFKSLSSSLQSTFKTQFFDDQKPPIAIETSCKTYNGKAIYVGFEGGCYYINSSGNKSYLDKALCNCN